MARPLRPQAHDSRPAWVAARSGRTPNSPRLAFKVRKEALRFGGCDVKAPQRPTRSFVLVSCLHSTWSSRALGESHRRRPSPGRRGGRRPARGPSRLSPPKQSRRGGDSDSESPADLCRRGTRGPPAGHPGRQRQFKFAPALVIMITASRTRLEASSFSLSTCFGA